jgi:PilZ domain-containing protein
MRTEHCPHCKGSFLRWSRHSTFLSSLLSRVSRFPFRCQLCGHCFWAFNTELDEIDDLGTDRREYDRISAKYPITFIGEDVLGDGSISNLSIQGCMIHTVKRAPLAAVISLSLFDSDCDAPIDIVKALVRHRSGNGFGVEFQRVNPKNEKRLRLRLGVLMSGTKRF